ncbi:MAG: phage holin family protein [Lachnospiraceae bacterium]|jgi:Na+/proline symporter|nr:phage holin family protein [Lachnospiraceae bacterium]
MEKKVFTELLINVLLSGTGGIIRKLIEQENNENHHIKTSRYIISAIVSLFVGLIVFFLCKSFEVSSYLTAGLTALSGYMGSPLLDLLVRRITKDAGLKDS